MSLIVSPSNHSTDSLYASQTFTDQEPALTTTTERTTTASPSTTSGAAVVGLDVEVTSRAESPATTTTGLRLVVADEPAGTGDGEARLAHPSSWRARADRAIAEQTDALTALREIRSASITLSGPADALVLRAECDMATEAVPLEVMRRLDDELPARLEQVVGLPLLERHLELTITQHVAVDAA